MSDNNSEEQIRYPFLTISSGLSGQYYIMLFDEILGPIEKIGCDLFDCAEEAKEHCKKLSEAYNVKCKI